MGIEELYGIELEEIIFPQVRVLERRSPSKECLRLEVKDITLLRELETNPGQSLFPTLKWQTSGVRRKHLWVGDHYYDKLRGDLLIWLIARKAEPYIIQADNYRTIFKAFGLGGWTKSSSAARLSDASFLEKYLDKRANTLYVRLSKDSLFYGEFLLPFRIQRILKDFYP